MHDTLDEYRAHKLIPLPWGRWFVGAGLLLSVGVSLALTAYVSSIDYEKDPYLRIAVFIGFLLLVAALLCLIVGGIVAVVSGVRVRAARQEQRNDLVEDLGVEITQQRNEITRLYASLAQIEHFATVAAQYDDELRGKSIRADSDTATTELRQAQRRLLRANRERNRLLKKKDRLTTDQAYAAELMGL